MGKAFTNEPSEITTEEISYYKNSITSLLPPNNVNETIGLIVYNLNFSLRWIKNYANQQIKLYRQLDLANGKLHRSN